MTLDEARGLRPGHGVWWGKIPHSVISTDLLETMGKVSVQVYAGGFHYAAPVDELSAEWPG